MLRKIALKVVTTALMIDETIESISLSVNVFSTELMLTEKATRMLIYQHIQKQIGCID